MENLRKRFLMVGQKKSFNLYGSGVLSHPWGIEVVVQARDLAMERKDKKEWIKEYPDTALAKAAQHWGFGPKIVY